VRQNLQAKCWH